MVEIDGVVETLHVKPSDEVEAVARGLCERRGLSQCTDLLSYLSAHLPIAVCPSPTNLQDDSW